MPEIPEVIPGEFIFDTWGNPVARRTCQRYTDFGQLGTLNPTPEDGDLAYVADSDDILTYHTGAWRGIAWNVEALSMGVNTTPSFSPRLNVFANSDDEAARFFRNTSTPNIPVIGVGSLLGESLFAVDAQGKVATVGIGIGIPPLISPRLNVEAGSSNDAARFFRNTSSNAGVIYVASGLGEARMQVQTTGDVFNVNGVYGTTSDERLKENIQPAGSYLDKLNAVEIMNFNMIDGDGQKLLGPIAQQVQQVIPGVVCEDTDSGMLQIKSSVFVPMLIQAVQELTARIEALES